MFHNLIERIAGRIRKIIRAWREEAILKDCTGVLHIGANQGQEREEYAAAGIPVVWVEPIPSVYEVLKTNLATFPLQRALKYLITDQDGKEYDFNISSNQGASSSIFTFERHGEIWPEVSHTGVLKLTSISLPTLVEKEQINLKIYNALVMDTQGSELLILRGGLSILDQFRYVKLEVADFEAYKGCCTLRELTDFMRSAGFEERHRHRFAKSPKGGAYYDIVYRKIMS